MKIKNNKLVAEKSELIGIPIITMWQPWATWVALGWKSIETRTHNNFAKLSGKNILIHAGLKYDKSAYDLASNFMSEHYRSQHEILEEMNVYPYGKILCIAKVEEIRELGHGDDSYKALIDCFDTKRYGLILNRIMELSTPIPIKGKQGIWSIKPKDINDNN